MTVFWLWLCIHRVLSRLCSVSSAFFVRLQQRLLPIAGLVQTSVLICSCVMTVVLHVVAINVVVGWLLSVPATWWCISGTDLVRQLYVL